MEEFDLNTDIQKMKKGYDTLLQEKGAPLSGGQKKRIVFIRSILRKANIYIFDEPTANVDSINSKKMMNHISKLAAKSLVIVITHDAGVINQYPGEIINL